jgi:NADH-quinone oxidoreductase subunit N
MKGAILLSFLSVIYLWRGYEFPFSFEATEALIFFLLSIAAIFFLVASLDMLIIYFSIELQGLCFYTLCVINRYANGATEAAIKYLLMSGLASSLLLFGTSLRYGETGTTNLSLWLELQAPGIPILASTLWVVLVVAFLVKVAASPFHM